MAQTWSNWSSHQSKNVAIKSCHIYHGEKNYHWNISPDFNFFYQIESNLSKMDQNGSNLIKLEFSTFSTFYKIIFFLSIYLPFIINFLDHIGSDLSKMDQNGSNLIKLEISPIKKSYYKKLLHLNENKHGQLVLTRSDDICPKWIKLDQTWSNFDFSPINVSYYSNNTIWTSLI